MGGSSLPEAGGGKKRKKALDAVINVVPAIDLLSCCIAFLLFTAVWTQISRLQAAPMGNSGMPAEVEAAKTLTVTLTIGERGYVLATSAGAPIELPAGGRGADGSVQYDLKGLGERLKKLKTEFPDQAAITVAADDAVAYQDLVHAIDACVGSGLANVSVMGAG